MMKITAREERVIDISEVIVSYKKGELYEVYIPHIISINIEKRNIDFNQDLSKRDAYSIAKYLWQKIDGLSFYEFPLGYEDSTNSIISKFKIKIQSYLNWTII